MTAYRKKLIEVALPLSQVNDASAYDKMPGIGPHPKGIHHWWARLPLPTARAILFASVVDDPSEQPDRFPTEEAQNQERQRLFKIIGQLMEKKLHEQPNVYREAHAEMIKHCDGKLPAVYDPFAGGGSIPIEANRLGFDAHAADLNPARRRVFESVGGSQIILSPLGSKALSLGALMAALDRGFTILYVESIGYSGDAAGLQEANNAGTSELVHIWLHGDAYGSQSTTEGAPL